MMEIIALTIIITILVVILFLALKKLIDNITLDSKDYYFKKMQDYDAKILEKEEALNKEEPVKEEIINKDKNRVNEIKSIDKEFLNTVSSSNYEGENAMKIANRVDEIFNINEEKILKEFLNNIKIDENYKIYQKLLDRFSPNMIYKLKMLDKRTQIKTIGNMISDEECEFFHQYIENNKFSLNNFLLDLEMLISNSIPHIEVRVGLRTKNYDYLSPYIKTVFSEDIYKGIIIKYQERIYDYSINERDV